MFKKSILATLFIGAGFLSTAHADILPTSDILSQTEGAHYFTDTVNNVDWLKMSDEARTAAESNGERWYTADFNVMYELFETVAQGRAVAMGRYTEVNWRADYTYSSLYMRDLAYYFVHNARGPNTSSYGGTGGRVHGYTSSYSPEGDVYNAFYFGNDSAYAGYRKSAHNGYYATSTIEDVSEMTPFMFRLNADGVANNNVSETALKSIANVNTPLLLSGLLMLGLGFTTSRKNRKISGF